MSSINRAPTGFLGFLGIKNFGRNPDRVLDYLSPTWDLQHLYYAANRTWVSTSATITGLGNFAVGLVPPAQVWYVHAFSFETATLAAGNDLDFQVCLFNNATGQSAKLTGGPRLAPVVGARAVAALDHPIILAANEALGVYVNRYAGANIPSTVDYVYTRLDA